MNIIAIDVVAHFTKDYSIIVIQIQYKLHITLIQILIKYQALRSQIY